MTARVDHPDGQALLQATRHALAGCCEGLDPHAVEPETPLAALLFDSLTAVKFIANLEAVLGVADLPFERWLAEHSERTEELTIRSLVDWLRATPQLARATTDGRVAERGYALGSG